MTQAKGVLPRGEDREVLYKNPQTCGYFIGVKLDQAIDRSRIEAWFAQVDRLVAQLVERLPATKGQEKGDKVAAVAVGLAPSFFTLNGAPRFSPAIEPPAAFRATVPSSVSGQPDLPNPLPNATASLAGVAVVDSDLLFYVASVYEARVNQFVSRLAALRPDVQAVTLDRGYQRIDGTEPFGYADGLRNIRTQERSKFVFVHRDERQVEEPAWADGGTYMAFIRILQQPDPFNALQDDATRDATIGRQKDGTRLDLVGQNIDAKHEPAEPTPNLPPTAHVRKAGPRSRHDDTQIFRRGLPFMETSADGQLRVGLNFCSFQASLDQFDVVFNDWMMNPRFPVEQGGGPDALLDPARQLTVIEKVGFFFVPPHRDAGLAAAVLAAKTEHGKPKTGQLVVRKRVVDQADPAKQFERGGFVFQVLDAQNQPVGGQFTSDSTGRAIAPAELTIGGTYTLQEVASQLVQNVQLTNLSFEMDKPHKQLVIVNQITQPNTPYGG
jgi:Dyp-type peroxidase family